MKTSALGAFGIATAITATLVTATGVADAIGKAPAAPLVDCGGVTGGGNRPAANARVIGGRVAGVSQQVVSQPVKVDDPKLTYWSKVALSVKEGTKPFTIAIVPTQRHLAAVTWGTSMNYYAAKVRVAPCPAGDPLATWAYFAGGYYVAKPMCVHLITDVGNRQVRTSVPIGKRC